MKRALVMLVTLCSVALPVHAEGVGDVDAAVFAAHTTSWTPLQITGGGGIYGFSSDLCLIASVSADGDEGGLAHPDLVCTSTMSGSYTFVVCGIGTMSGQLVINELDPLDPSFVRQYLINYTVTVVGGIGALTGAGSEDGGATFSDPVAGVVLLDSAARPTLPVCLTEVDMQAVLASTV